MMDWDDVRFFLALARTGSVRGAGLDLRVSHTTVARRIDNMEKDIGVRLFDRTPAGYVTTVAGEDMMQTALGVEEDMNGLERRLLGQDSRLEGHICVTFPDALTTQHIMPEIVEFSEQYPDIELEFVQSYRAFDLSKREADIAIRALRQTSSPADFLIGRKLVSVHYAHYASKEYLEKHDLDKDKQTVRWTKWDEPDVYPAWIKDSMHPDIPGRHMMADAVMQMQAAKAGLGIASLACISADADPELVRLPNSISKPYYDMWILSHPDLRETARLRIFREFITKAILSKKHLYEGQPIIA